MLFIRYFRQIDLEAALALQDAPRTGANRAGASMGLSAMAERATEQVQPVPFDPACFVANFHFRIIHLSVHTLFADRKFI